MTNRISLQYNLLVVWFEKLLAFIGVVLHAIGCVRIIACMDWKATDTLYELMSRVLLLAIGLEFVRILVTRDLMVVLELLAFVTARKILKPDITALDIALSVLAFVALLAALEEAAIRGEDIPLEGWPGGDFVEPSEKGIVGVFF